MRIIVTGGTGFIGRHLLGTLASQHELICLVRDSDRLEKIDGLTIIEGNLNDFQSFNRLPPRADAIVHLAQANVSFPEAANELFAVNLASTQWLAAYARRAGISHFVYASSGSVYLRTIEPLQETSVVQPLDFYSLTKYFSEGILSWYKDYFAVCILRLFTPYGAGQKNRMIPNILQLVREGKTVLLVNEGRPLVNPIYIDDLIRLIMQALRLPGYHVVNVAGPQVVSIQDIASIAGELLGRPPVLERRKEAESWNLIADTTKMCQLFRSDRLLGPAEGIRCMLEEQDLAAQIAGKHSS